jgi:CMP-N,N'-diacetyllegionaminic acid synthase
MLVVVPARGGSKGIPRKNLCLVGGTSLVGRAAKLASLLPWADAALVSTDDEEIAREAVRHGIDAPFLRPTHLAGDDARSVDVWRHAWLAGEQHYGMRFDASVLLEPTSPLRLREDVERTVATLFAGDYAAAATVSPTPAHYAPEKALVLDSKNLIRPYLASGSEPIRQFVPTYYHRNGAAYAVTRETLLIQQQILPQGCAAVVIDRNIVNIDEHFELELANWLLGHGLSDR